MPGTATTILIDGTPTDGSDPWIDSLVTGGAWKDSNGGTVTIQWTAFQGTMDGQNSYGWTSLALAGLREAMSLWESVANIDFVEVSGAANADVRFWWGTEAQAGGANVLGWSDLPGFSDYYEVPASETRDILFNAQDSAFSGALGKGGLGLLTMVHEIGHLLGLAHPHDGGPASDATTFQLVDNPYDTGNGGLNQGIYTVMSYNFGWPSHVPDHTAESWGLTYGPMSLDIAAIQTIYGANTTYAAGDDVYLLPKAPGSGTYWASIWDTGGIDTISAVGVTTNTTIDLHAPTDAIDGIALASFSRYEGDMLGGYTIARGVVIENAIGGNSNDWLYGNEVSNRLEGGDGNDRLDGREGADTMIGGAGADGYYIDDVGDVIVELDGSSGIDWVISTLDDYTLGANVEDVSLEGSWGSINAKGNSLANAIRGNEGDNILDGAGGADTLDGRDGNDRLVVSDLSFAKIDGGAGNDTFALDGAGLVLDLSNPALAMKFLSIERIDLAGAGNNTLILNQGAVFNIGAVVGSKRILIVEGNAGDQVKFAESTWTNAGSFTNADGTFDRWVLGNTEAHVEKALSPSGVTIVGTAGNDIISTTVSVPGQPVATSYGDTIDGGAGDDGMAGGLGDDAYYVDSLLDVVVEAANAGRDKVFASSSYVLGTNVEDLTLTGTANINATGNTLNNVLVGNAGNNVLDGGAGDDTMAGGLGDDTYYVDTVLDVVLEDANAGRDQVFAGVGYVLGANVEDLTLTGTASIDALGNALNNILVGNSGNNVLDGTVGDDTMAGGSGDDTYYVDTLLDVVIEEANAGRDTVVSSVSHVLGANVEGLTLAAWMDVNATGNALNNVLVGNTGNNVLNGGAGADTMAGGLGDDSYYVDTVLDVVVEAANAGRDRVLAGASYVLGANVENLTLTGSASIDGTGNALANSLIGNTGNNVLDGGGGNDTMAGGLGDDTYVVDAAGDVVTEGVHEGTDVVQAWLDWTLGANVETLKLMGTGHINGTGNDQDNTLTGNSGNNLLSGAGGDDTLDGGTGGDAMVGGLGDDTYVVDSLGDLVTEGVGEGTDTVNAWLGWTLGANFEQLRLMGTTDLNGTGNNLNNALFGNAGNNDLNGGAGADTMSGGAGNDTYVVDDSGDVVVEAAGGGVDTVLSSVSWTLGANIERLALSGVQAINGTGNEMNNALTGNAANNVLDGGLGADSMTGGLGNDTYFVDGNSDAVIEAENAGIDTVHSTASYKLSANVEKLVLLGVAHLNGTGNELANALTGNAGDNILDGGLGADTMSGGLGNDTYLVDSNSDAVIEAADAGIDTVRATVSYRLAANVEKLALLGTANLSGTGNELANVVTGNAGDNTLDGGLGADTMTGGLGNDTYLVEASDDLVIEGSGAGIDLVRATASYRLSNNVENLTLLGTANLIATGNGLANILTGNAGHNTLDGGLGADTMAGGLGDDTYLVDAAGDVVSEAAGGGFDTVQAWVSHTLSAHVEALTLMGSGDLEGIGNTLANTLSGNAGRNLLDGGAGADTMAGGAGNDRYIVDNVGDVVIEAAAGGLDTVQSSVTYALGANVENLVLAGTGTLSATGNALANNLTGNAGRNTLDGGLGADTMAGGLGDDTYVVDASGDIVIEAENAGVDAVLSTMSYSLSANIERLTLLGAADLTGTGNALANVLAGNAGNNTLDGGVGADKMSGGLGDDTYLVDINTDVVVEAADAGIDTVRAMANYRLAANVENLTLLGTANLLGFGNELANVLTGNAGNNTLDGAAGADTMAGGAGNDVYVVDDSGDVVIEAAAGGNDMVQAWASHVLAANVESLRLMGTTDLEGTGNTLANTLFGNAGKNILDGGAGADTMTGGAGDDTYIVDHASDRVVETVGGGSDTVRSSITCTLSGGIETLILTGSAAVGGKGNAENNVLIGNGANNGLDGGAGIDTMIGGDGNDIYVVENAGDAVIEMANGGTDAVRAWIDYTLTDNVETLTLYGTADIDATGNALANALTGNSGRNVLDGGLGADVLIGASGDSFRFSTGLGADNVDRIARFEHTANTIELDHTIFATLGIGTLDAGAFNTGAVSTQADDRILFHASSQALYYDADGAGGAAAIKFASIGVLVGTLDHTDFLIV